MVKVERSFPAPASLAEEAQKDSGRYDGPDVVKQLRESFWDKCYICEMASLQDPVIEHLLPHKNGKYKDRKFDWNNLFLSCGHCNSVKKQQKYDEGIIDCCKTDPEELIYFRLQENTINISAIDDEDEKALLTAMLIQEVFEAKKKEAMLRRKSAFAAFKRNYVRENRDIYPQLMPYIR